jgi:hypothetical protein
VSDDSAVSPNYYKGFTNGAQPIDITEHLTGNAAQAVQYLTRACRTDGVIKEDPIGDVEKCLYFVERELSRLKREQDTRTILGSKEQAFLDRLKVLSPEMRHSVYGIEPEA